jgi:hypothetical protein
MHMHLGWLAFPLAMTMSACVIPIAPQFDDPEVNYPPFVVDSDPAIGDILTPAAAMPGGAPPPQRVITVTLGDHNLNDVLFLRLLMDYPTTDPDGGQLVAVPAARPPSGRVDRTPFRLVPPPCSSAGAGTHRLVLSVSDREFLDRTNGDSVSTEAPLDSVRATANRMRAVWLLNCP